MAENQKNATDEFVAPEGYSTKTEKVTVGDDIEYEVQYLQADSLEAVQNYLTSQGVSDFDSWLLNIVNDVQKNRATQGGKSAVRAAKDADALAKAIANHQKNSIRYLLGKPRASGIAGVTVATQREFGTRMVAAIASKGAMLTDEELEAIAKDIGVDLAEVMKSGS